MTHFRCAACDRPLLTVATKEEPGESRTWAVRARCGYPGCGGFSFWQNLSGRLFPMGFEGRTAVCGQDFDDESVTFSTRPA